MSDLEQRIPEPQLMDDEAQAEAYATTDFSEPHQAFVTHFTERFPDFSGGEVMDLGCSARSLGRLRARWNGSQGRCGGGGDVLSSSILAAVADAASSLR